MSAKTTIAIDPAFTENRIWLNGEEVPFDNPRLMNCVAEIRRRAAAQNQELRELNWKIHICSENNFPTAAGLSSSSAGYACIVFCLAKLYKIEGDISSLARLGSGSACRSLQGGFVHWSAGKKDDGSDSMASQLVDETYWPEMRVLILVVDDKKKKISSKDGMVQSVKTSELLKYRTSVSVPARTKVMIEAIKNRDFETFAKITMQESNQFHAVCMDTYPPLPYMNDVSHAIAATLHQINKDAGKNIVSYTYDAGPNACLYLLEENVAKVLAELKNVFLSSKPEKDYYNGLPINTTSLTLELGCSYSGNVGWQDAIKYVIYTRIGSGPRVLPDSASLLDGTGLPWITA